MLQNQDILNYGSIGSWFPFEDEMSGTMEWYRKDNDSVVVYATPNWTDDGVVPVGLSFDNGNYTNVTTFELNPKETIEYQLNQYISIISVILSNLK